MIVERFGESVHFLEAYMHPPRIELLCCQDSVQPQISPSQLTMRSFLIQSAVHVRNDQEVEVGLLMREFARVLDLNSECVAQGIRLRTDGAVSMRIGDSRLFVWCPQSETLQKTLDRQLDYQQHDKFNHEKFLWEQI